MRGRDGAVTTLANVSQPGAASQTFTFTLLKSGPINVAVGVSTPGISNLQVLSVSAIPEPTTAALVQRLYYSPHSREAPGGYPPLHSFPQP